MSLDTVIHPAPSTRDAVEELRADHRRIERVLADCARLEQGGAAASSSADRSALVARLGALLQAHLQVKHELFEPALAGAAAMQAEGAPPVAHPPGEPDGAHGSLLALLQQLSTDAAEPASFAQALHDFGTAWRAHVDREESDQLPRAQELAARQQIDLLALGTAMAQRRGELLGDQGVD